LRKAAHQSGHIALAVSERDLFLAFISEQLGHNRSDSARRTGLLGIEIETSTAQLGMF
jgi:hypothetical protein